MADAVERNKAASEEVRKEHDIATLGKISHIEDSDARNSELKFMYCQPVSDKTGPPSSSALPPVNGADDALTREFKEKLLRKVTGAASSSSSSSSCGHSSCGGTSNIQDGADEVPGDELDEELDEVSLRELEMRRREEDRLARRNKTGKYSANYAASAVQSELERELGLRHRGGGMSQAELEQRFPQLKNAPVEGEYAGSVQIRHKPFAGVIRYVQCKRCGVWGHATGDRECALREYNPQDLARQQREDPMASQLSSASVVANALELDKQKLVYARAVADMQGIDGKTAQYLRNKNIALRSGAQHSGGGSGTVGGRVTNFGGGDTEYELVNSDDGEESLGLGHVPAGASDLSCESISEELLLLASLTGRQKRLLVGKLQEAHASQPDAVSELLDIILLAEEDRGQQQDWDEVVDEAGDTSRRRRQDRSTDKDNYKSKDRKRRKHSQ